MQKRLDSRFVFRFRRCGELQNSLSAERLFGAIVNTKMFLRERRRFQGANGRRAIPVENLFPPDANVGIAFGGLTKNGLSYRLRIIPRLLLHRRASVRQFRRREPVVPQQNSEPATHPAHAHQRQQRGRIDGKTFFCHETTKWEANYAMVPRRSKRRDCIFSETRKQA